MNNEQSGAIDGKDSVKLLVNFETIECSLIKNKAGSLVGDELLAIIKDDDKEEENKEVEEEEADYDYYYDDIDEDEEDIDEYLKINRIIRNDSCCILTNLINSDSAYSSTTVTSTTSSSPKSTTSSLFKLSTDSLTSSSFESTASKFPSSQLSIGYSGRAKQTPNDDYSNSHLNQLNKIVLSNYLGEHTNDLLLNMKLNYGDDCSFILSMNKLNYFFGIADGVSANRSRGYDASLFPLALLKECAHFILNDSETVEQEEEEKALGLSSSSSSPLSSNGDLMLLDNNDCHYLYKNLLKSHLKVQENCVYGSSTVCLFSLKFQTNSNGILSTCNLGDSGYMIIRNKSVLYKSQSQSHRYNAPFQLGCTPPELLEHDLYRDKPDDSIVQTHEIQSGDLLVISTDGLFDNLYEDEIAMIISEHINDKLKENGRHISLVGIDDQDQSANHDPILINSLEEAVNKLDINLDDKNDKTLNFNNLISSDMLESACDLLIQKASKAGIKRDDMLIMLIYVD